MNNKNLWIASLSGAAVSLLATNLPYIGLINCMLCAGFWGSAVFAVWLYRRLGGKVTIPEGIKIGALSGLIAWAIGLLLSFLCRYHGTCLSRDRLLLKLHDLCSNFRNDSTLVN